MSNLSTQAIANAINPDPIAIFRRNAKSFVTSCMVRSEWVLGGCYYKRGHKRVVRVYLDEGRLLGGMSELSMHRAEHLHSMDWLKDTGVLRVYTKWFIERMNNSRTMLAPFTWPVI